jgi:hypothetical protein
MRRGRSHLSGPGIPYNHRCPAITTAREVRHQQQPSSFTGRNQQLPDSSQLRSTAASSPILCSLPMPYAGMWQAGPMLERRHHNATAHSPALKVHENERIGHLTLASIGAKYCGNCGQLMFVLDRNHRCERHLSLPCALAFELKSGEVRIGLRHPLGLSMLPSNAPAVQCDCGTTLCPTEAEPRNAAPVRRCTYHVAP